MRKIRCNKSLLEEKEFAEIFRHPIGVQIYLAIGTSHLRSQHFNGSILNVVRYLTERKTLPKTPEELITAFQKHGRGDAAAQWPWMEYQGYDPATERNAKRISDRTAKFQELLDAINGINAWEPIWV